MEVKWAVLFLCFAILVMTLVEFIALDKKMQRAIEKQGEINQRSYLMNKDQSEYIRLLKSDINIIYRLAITGEFEETNDDN